MFAHGGHAVDAAVAASLYLGVIGGRFILIRKANVEAKVFDIKEMAPKRAYQDVVNNVKYDFTGGKTKSCDRINWRNSDMFGLYVLIQKLQKANAFNFLIAAPNASYLVIEILLLSMLASMSCNPNIHPPSRRELVITRSGAVATDQTICSNIGKDVLVNGGHAVDAAVAAALCLGVVDPPYSGLGGGGFMLVRNANGEARVFDVKETAPKRAFKNMYNKHPCDQIRGIRSIAVPGQLAGLYAAWKDYGKLPWNKLVSPAEDLARHGFKISKSLSEAMEYEILTLKRNPTLRSIFTNDGKPLKQGQTLIQETLANTLAQISKNGMMVFYNGSIGRSLVDDIMRSKGILSMQDLQSYRHKIRKPITADVMGLQIISAPPPASGGAVTVLVLKILEQYGFPSGISGPLGIHRTIEALKYALAMRMELGDPDFVKIYNTLTSMLSTSTARKLRSMINDAKTYPSNHYGGKWRQKRDHGTTHICVVDSQRNVVSMSASLNSMFGSGYMSPSTGILLNNQMFGFSTPNSTEPPPAPANFIRPYKRPLSSIAPTVILKGGEVKAVIGAAGGTLIPDAVIEVILNHFARKMDPLSSVMAPRYYHWLHPNMLYFENYTWMGDKYRAPRGTVKYLISRGHRVLGDSGRATWCQFIVEELDSGKLFAVSDPRKGGFPAGY
ncbi:hypothetical protein RD792_008616 [Penstemon davidsonii]|uniref:Glutathione hydrolase n=1 Tax=Penstemon davidsonii TaxID=160366 RepID=A0ABR0DB82_9LAMI|nr:hypothetical protein RD792_008616 [Penstemon davidsonii]